MLRKIIRFIHPITLAVILVGVAGFLVGLIVAVERQEADLAPQISVANLEQTERLEAALDERDSALAAQKLEIETLRAELAAHQQTTIPSTALTEAQSRVSSLEAALTDNRAELSALQSELNGLSGHLAEAIQTRDELRGEISELRSQLAEAAQSASDQSSELDQLRQQLSEAAQSASVQSSELDQLRQQLSDATQAADDQRSEIGQLRQQLSEAEKAADELRTENNQARIELTEAIQSKDTSRNEVEKLRRLLTQSSLSGDEQRSEVGLLRAQLTEALQTQSELRSEIGQLQRTGASERADFERQIANLNSEIESLQARLEAPPPATPEAASNEAPDTATAQAQSSAPTSAAATPDQTEATPPQPQPTTPSTQAGSITQGIAAYRAAEYRRAYELWIPRALAGSSRAQFFVGALYLEGRGVEKNLVTSFLWLRSAARSNDPGAIRLLDRVRAEMTDTELAEVETRIANGETLPNQ